MLDPSGVVTVDDRDLPVYQCDECTVPTDIGGERFDAALTFCVGEDGRPFDPASPDGEIQV
jgi:hypothetical protein